MTTTQCKKHGRRNCLDRSCAADRQAQAAEERQRATADPLADPTSLTHQMVYGGAYYGSTADTGSSRDTDCGNTSSGYESSGSSSTSDSGSSSSCDSGGSW